MNKLAAVCAIGAVFGCGGDSTIAPADPALRTVSLIRLAEQSAAGAAKVVETWTLRRDHRAVLVQEPPAKTELGPIRGDPGCVLRFGLGLRPSHWRNAGPIEFNVKLAGAAGRGTVFRDTPAPAAVSPAAWC